MTKTDIPLGTVRPPDDGPSITALVRSFQAEHPTWDPDVMTEHVLAALSRRQLAAIAQKLVRHEVQRQLRYITRTAEHAASSLAQTAPDRYRQLTDHSFMTPDGRWVPWDKATIDDHLAYAGWCRDRAGRLIVTAELHEDAAKQCADAGVSCLADLDEEAA